MNTPPPRSASPGCLPCCEPLHGPCSCQTCALLQIRPLRLILPELVETQQGQSMPISRSILCRAEGKEKGRAQNSPQDGQAAGQVF